MMKIVGGGVGQCDSSHMLNVFNFYVLCVENMLFSNCFEYGIVFILYCLL